MRSGGSPVPPSVPWVAPASPPPPTNWTPLLVAIIVAAVIGLGALGFALTRSDSDPTAGPDTTAGVSITTAPPTERSSTTRATVAPTASATTTPTTAAPPVTTSPSPPSGSWIAVLESLPRDDPALASAVEGLIERPVPTAVLYSDDYASLTPGFAVIYAGPYATSSAAIDVCHSLGYMTSDQCYAAPLSQSTSDRGVRVYP